VRLGEEVLWPKEDGSVWMQMIKPGDVLMKKKLHAGRWMVTVRGHVTVGGRFYGLHPRIIHEADQTAGLKTVELKPTLTTQSNLLQPPHHFGNHYDAAALDMPIFFRTFIDSTVEIVMVPRGARRHRQHHAERCSSSFPVPG
jgi:hypothetical protein